MTDASTGGEVLTGRSTRTSPPKGYSALQFVGVRVIAGLGLILVVSFVVFMAVSLLPGDIVAAALGKGASPERIEIVREQLNLDRPVIVRYFEWLGAALTGNFGYSIVSGAPVADLVWPRFRNTLILGGCAAAVIFPLALVLGTWAGARKGRLSDRASSLTGVIFLAVPEFAAGTFLVYFFAVQLSILPAVSMFDPSAGPFSSPTSLVLPVLTLTLVSFGFAMRYVRSSVAASMESDYVRMARLNGVSEREVVVKYALRNSLAPIIQVVSLTFLAMLAGVAITETVFSYPGLGALMVSSSLNRDFTTLVAASALIAALYAVINTINDIAIVYINPRLRTRVGA